MQEMWVKVIFPGMDPIFGSLQGRITAESFDKDAPERVAISEESGAELLQELRKALRWCVDNGAGFKLFDPIQLRGIPQQNGQMATVTIPIIQSLEPAVEENFVNVNGAQVLWWAVLTPDTKWQQIVDRAIHGIETATGVDEIPHHPDEGDGDSIIIRPKF